MVNFLKRTSPLCPANLEIIAKILGWAGSYGKMISAYEGMNARSMADHVLMFEPGKTLIGIRNMAVKKNMIVKNNNSLRECWKEKLQE